MTLTLEYATPGKNKPMETVWDVLLRLMFGFAGIALPTICFALASGGIVGPEWQSHAWFDRPSMLLWHTVGWPLYPLTAFAMLGMAVAIISVRWAARRPWCRFAVYTGIPVALFYLTLLAIGVAKPTGSAFWIIAGVGGSVLIGLVGALAVVLIILAVRWVTMRWGTLRQWLLIMGGIIVIPLIVAGLASLFGGARAAEEILGVCIGAPVVGCLFGAPSLALAAYGVMAYRLACHPEAQAHPLWINLAAAIAWLAGFGLAWKAAADIAVREYAKLPTRPPDCYIATTAARGHRRWVGARRVSIGSRLVPINNQLRYCKGFEIILAATCPRGHRALRRFYDTLGPALAGTLRNRLLADAAFVLLKPAEWLARSVVRRAGVEQRVLHLYDSRAGQ